MLVGDSSCHTGERIFAYGLCTCGDVSMANTLDLDAFDSRDGPYTSGWNGAWAGINGRLHSDRPLMLWGSMFVGNGFHVNGDLWLEGDLHSGGDSVAATMDVAGDAQIRVRACTGGIEVGGTLTMPQNAILEVHGGPMTYSSFVRDHVDVPEPCDCNPSSFFDVGAYAGGFEHNNDNAAAGIGGWDFENVQGHHDVTIDCGRIYLSRLTGAGSMRFVVTGRTAIFIDGDVSLNSGFEIDVSQGGEVDLFVSGNFNVNGPTELGTASEPGRVRVHVGGSGTINVTSMTVAGYLYAPTAELVARGAVEIFGSAFLRRLHSTAPVSLHQDEALDEGGDRCCP